MNKIHELEVRIAKLEGILEGKEEVIGYLKAALSEAGKATTYPWVSAPGTNIFPNTTSPTIGQGVLGNPNTWITSYTASTLDMKPYFTEKYIDNNNNITQYLDKLEETSFQV